MIAKEYLGALCIDIIEMHGEVRKEYVERNQTI